MKFKWLTLYILFALPLSQATEPDNIFVERTSDLNLDAFVDVADLGILLSKWGTSEADLNDDGVTDVSDLAIVISEWSPPLFNVCAHHLSGDGQIWCSEGAAMIFDSPFGRGWKRLAWGFYLVETEHVLNEVRSDSYHLISYDLLIRYERRYRYAVDGFIVE